VTELVSMFIIGRKDGKNKQSETAQQTGQSEPSNSSLANPSRNFFRWLVENPDPREEVIAGLESEQEAKK
jgi:hypothetical protein